MSGWVWSHRMGVEKEKASGHSELGLGASGSTRPRCVVGRAVGIVSHVPNLSRLQEVQKNLLGEHTLRAHSFRTTKCKRQPCNLTWTCEKAGKIGKEMTFWKRKTIFLYLLGGPCQPAGMYLNYVVQYPRIMRL